MEQPNPRLFDVLAARRAYREGRNVTETLRQQRGLAQNTAEIIETAYDLQAGTYMEAVAAAPEAANAYAAEVAALLDPHLPEGAALLDVGTGELTTLSLLSRHLAHRAGALLAFDISWSRLAKGRSFAQREMREPERLHCFCADMAEIPLADKSVDVTTSSHALEPNGGRLPQLLRELFRVTSGTLVLFEPCYEINSDEGRARMDRLGYIRDVEGAVRALGGTVRDRIALRHVANPLNPTACFVITPPPGGAPSQRVDAAPSYSVPGTSHSLQRVQEGYFSAETGLFFPVLDGIPVLKMNSAVLASALLETP
jgi:SAM-dependent methyltransferase